MTRKNSHLGCNNVTNPGFNSAGVFAFGRNATFTNKNSADSLGWEMRAHPGQYRLGAVTLVQIVDSDHEAPRVRTIKARK